MFSFRYFYFLILIAFVFSACSKQVDPLSRIPNDVDMVISLNPVELAKKGNLAELKNSKAYLMLEEDIRSSNKKLADQLPNLLSNPTELGIDLFKDIFCFEEVTNFDHSFLIYYVSLSSRKRFEEFILDATQKKEGLVKSMKNFDYLPFQKGLIGWDKKSAFFVFPQNEVSTENVLSYLTKLITLDASKSISMHNDFKKFYAAKQDVNIWFTSDVIESILFYWSKEELEDAFDIDLDNNFLHGYLAFSKGELSLTFAPSLNEKTKKRFEKYNPIQHKGISKETLNKIKYDDLLILGGISIKPDKYKSLTKEISSFLERDGTFDQPYRMNQYMTNFLNNMDGDIALMIENLKENKSYYTTSYNDLINNATISFTIKDEPISLKILKEEYKNLEEEKSFYHIKERSNEYYIGLKDNLLTYTSDSTYFNIYNNKKTLLDHEQSSQLIKNPVFLYLSLDSDQYSNETRKLIQQLLGNRFASFQALNTLNEALIIEMPDNSTLKVTLSFKEKDQNGLTTLIQAVNQSFEIM